MYGACFETTAQFDEWNAIYAKISVFQEDMTEWDERNRSLPSVLMGIPRLSSYIEKELAVLQSEMEHLEEDLLRRERIAFDAGRRSRGL